MIIQLKILYNVQMFKQIVLVFNTSLSLYFFMRFSQYLVLLSPVFHILLYFTPASCYSNHCKSSTQKSPCSQCGLDKWVRMRHCYRCSVCIHKYDHHCILLDICIGQPNQKFFILFLWSHLMNSGLQIFGYFGQIKYDLWMDQKGYEHLQLSYYLTALTIIYYILSFLVTGYLSLYHSWLISHNQTTYEMKKRLNIPYFRKLTDLSGHPFSKGIFNNWIRVFKARANQPIDWEEPTKIG